MKITQLKTFLVPPRWLFLKVETDAGVSGWGEPVLEGRAETLAALVAEMADFVMGMDPRKINDIWQMLYRNGCYRGGPALMSALSGIETAGRTARASRGDRRHRRLSLLGRRKVHRRRQHRRRRRRHDQDV